MKFRFPLAMMLAALIFSLVAAPVGAQIADGTYEVNYEMKEANSDNTSIADGYFTGPATLTVESGVQTVTLTVTGVEYIQSLTAPSGPVQVVSESSDNKTVQFQVSDVTQPVSMDMHIIVPDMYDQTHTARAVFDTSNLPAASSSSDESTAAEGSSGDASNNEAVGEAEGEVVENPKTGENSSMILYGSLMLVAVIGLVGIWKFRPANSK